MTNLKTVKKTLAAVTLAAATLALPVSAQAQSFNDRNCSDTGNAVLGGVVGGTLGTVLGEEIAGRRDRTEGAILGGIIGGIAGAAIGDSASDCENRNARFRTTNNFRTVSRPVVSRPVFGVQNVGYTTTRGYAPTYQRTTYNNSRRVDPLYRIDREIDQLRYERDRLKKERKYSHRYNPRIERRLDQIAYELDCLKDERKRIKKYGTSRRTVYSTTRRRAY